jgi:tol-pal system protein YbgF
MRALRRQYDVAQAGPAAAAPSAPTMAPYPSSNTLISIQERVAALRKEVAATGGGSQDVRNRLDALNARLSALVKDIDLALNVVDKPAQVRAEPLPQMIVTTPAPASTNYQQQFYQAIGLLNDGKAEEARSMLKSFLDAHPTDELAPNAKYWMGESYLASQDYTAAGWLFAEGYESDMKGPLASHNLLKLGVALAQLDKKPLACATFNKLETDFPNASDQLQVARQERRNAGCR